MEDPRYIEMMQFRKLAVTCVDIPEIHMALVDITVRHRERVRSGVERAREQGHIRSDVDIDYVAWMWTGITLAGCYREALFPGGFTEMIPIAEGFIDSLR